MNIIYFYFPVLTGLLAIIVALFWRTRVKKESSGSDRMKEIAAAIEEGSRAYLKRQSKVVSAVAIILAAGLWFFFDFMTAFGFLIGAAASGLAGYFGMLTAVSTNAKVAESAKKGLAPAFRLAFLGGSVTGFLVVGLGLLTVSLFWIFTKDINALIGLGFGGSLISVFSRLGGGIYTKGADVGADLVGKIEAGIPEDDPRNPAVIADNVGDNVGDCAGMAADLFETYAVTIISTMLLGHLLFPESAAIFLYPLALGAIAVIGSLLGTLFVKADKQENIMAGLYRGLIASGVISAVFFAPATQMFVKKENLGEWLNVYLAGLIGLAITILMVIITEYYTSTRFQPVKSIAKSSQSGHATNIITGLAISLEAPILPIIVITLGMLAAWSLFGLYGIAVAAVAMLSLAGIIVAIDSFGPITDNAGGIAEMSQAPPEIRAITDALDAVGNTTKAVTKGYAIASAGLAALVLFGAYIAEIEKLGKKIIFELQDPLVLAGIFFGAILPYLFSSLTMLAVGKTAEKIVAEVRRQFKEISGLMEGTAKPDYARVVDIATKSALKEMILPALLPIIAVIAVALIFGLKTLGGLLIGIIVTGLFIALSMTYGGAAWDNANKYIEKGNHGGKGSLAHQAAITGDTVGDPYKDTAGPAINPMIKVVNIIALLLVRLLV